MHRPTLTLAVTLLLAACGGGPPPDDEGSTILQPESGAIFGPGTPITFVGEADPEFGSVLSVTWTSSLNGVFGDELLVMTTALMTGPHTITFTVEYPDTTASATISIFVGAAAQTR